MSRSWTDGEVLPLTRGSVLGVLLLLLGLGALVFTPPGAMNPWIFGAAIIGALVGLVALMMASDR